MYILINVILNLCKLTFSLSSIIQWEHFCMVLDNSYYPPAGRSCMTHRLAEQGFTDASQVSLLTINKINSYKRRRKCCLCTHTLYRLNRLAFTRSSSWGPFETSCLYGTILHSNRDSLIRLAVSHAADCRSGDSKITSEFLVSSRLHAQLQASWCVYLDSV
jgi:hypothetical protein